jgi:hypothetical protein
MLSHIGPDGNCMQYSYSEKFFARDLFDAVKAQLQDPFASSLPSSRPWLEMMSYGDNLHAFSRQVKFRYKRGDSLHTGSIPLCSQDPAFLGGLPRKRQPSPSPFDAFLEKLKNDPDPFGLGLGDSSALHGGESSTPRLPSEISAAGAHEEHSDDQAPALPPRTSRISTAVLSTLLSIAAAVSVGIMVSNNHTFKFGDGSDSTKQATAMLDETASTVHGRHATARLTLDQTLPASKVFPAVSDAEPSSEIGTSASRTEKRTKSRYSSKARSRSGTNVPGRKITEDAKLKAAASPRTSSSTKTRLASAPDGKHSASLQARNAENYPGTQYARCERVRGLLRREKCKWDVCNGKWGKQGCPAYQHNARPEFGYEQVGKLGQSKPAASGRTQDGG